jgi:hypothetical protein
VSDPTIARPPLLEKISCTDLLQEMIGLIAQHLMDLKAETLTGAP